MTERCSFCGKSKTTESLDPCACESSTGSSYRPSLKIRLGIFLGLFVLFSLLAAAISGIPYAIAWSVLLPAGLGAFGGGSPVSGLLVMASYFLYLGLLVSVFVLSGRWLGIAFFALCVLISISLVGFGKIASSFAGIH